MKLKQLVLAALLALAPAVAGAQQKVGYVTWQEDLTATSYTYCSMAGLNGDPFGEPFSSSAAIKTTGSSTSVTEATAGTNPFTALAVGDLIIVRKSPTVTDRVSIVTRADPANVTVSTAVDWSAGYQFRYLKKACGSAVTNGWFSVGTFSTIQSTLEWVTKNATSLEMQTECAIGPGQPVIVATQSATAVGQWSQVVTAGVYDRCRLGLKLTADTGTQLVNATFAVKW